MDLKIKGELISSIMSLLKLHHSEKNKPYNAADTFFSLAFMNDCDLNNIAKLMKLDGYK